MLMRDFGFRIYRGLCSLPEKPKEKDDDKKKDKKDDKKKDDDRKTKKDDKRDEKKNEKDKKDDKDAKSKSDDKDKDKNDDDDDDDDDDSDVSIQCYWWYNNTNLDKFRKEIYESFFLQDDDSLKDGKRDKDKDGKRKKIKLYTHDPYLLLSFVYFDQTHCGYIFDKDIEELIYTLGLNLSRAQVRKLVQKVVTRDSLHYRKLTDRLKEDDGKDSKKDDNEKSDGSSGKAENEEEILKSLALGRLFLAFYQLIVG